MAGIEWGPKNIPQKDRILRTVTQFTGRQLQEISYQVISALKGHPNLNRDRAISNLTDEELRPSRAAERMQLGLDVLNQLAVVRSDGHDVRSVIVHQDINNKIQQTPAEGEPHQYYTIDWVREPEQKQTTLQKTNSRTVEMHHSPTPTEQAERRAAKRVRQRERRKASRAAEKQEGLKIEQWEREFRAERKAIDEVIIDATKEMVDGARANGSIKIETAEDNKAKVLYKDRYSNTEHTEVDRVTGEYQLSANDPDYTDRLRPDLLPYINHLATLAEGGESNYEPSPLPPERYQDIYERAIKTKALKVISNTDGSISFQYVKYPQGSLFTIFMIIESYGDIDLNRKTILVNELNAYERPINPHFANLLKEKKAELEGAVS